MGSISDDALRVQRGVDFVGVTTSFLCYDKSGEFVMAKRGQSARDEQGSWDIGAGALDWGVTAEENVRREVLEEYGAKALKIDFIGYGDIFRKLADGTPTHWLLLSFSVLVNREDVRNNEPERFDDIGWFTLGTLPQPLHSQQLPFFQRYEKQFRTIIH